MVSQEAALTDKSETPLPIPRDTSDTKTANMVASGFRGAPKKPDRSPALQGGEKRAESGGVKDARDGGLQNSRTLTVPRFIANHTPDPRPARPHLLLSSHPSAPPPISFTLPG